MTTSLILVASMSLVAPARQAPVRPLPRYTVVVLRRSTDRDSTIGTAVGGGWQGGYAVNPSEPIIFRGRSDRWRSLLPAGVWEARILGMDERQQVGFTLGSNGGPCVWSGTAESYVNLLPEGWISGQATAVHDGRQVGWGSRSFYDARALLWRGTRESWVDLTPPGWEFSAAYGIHGDVVVGSATYRNAEGPRGGLWRLDEGNRFVPLNPTWGDGCQVYGAGPGEQVGYVAHPVTNKFHAALWRGTPESCVDLMPYGALQSRAYGTNGRQQVGRAFWGGERTWACVWSGSRGSWHDLHQYLPRSANFVQSEALAIDAQGNIVGFAKGARPGSARIILWRPNSVEAQSEGDWLKGDRRRDRLNQPVQANGMRSDGATRG
jgi:hypothetical protein